MKLYPTKIYVYTGAAWAGDYIDIQKDEAALDLSDYDLQMQIIDTSDSTVLVVPTILKDGSETGRIWPSMTPDETASLDDKKADWVLLLRPSNLSSDPKPVAIGSVSIYEGATWQS